MSPNLKFSLFLSLGLSQAAFAQTASPNHHEHQHQAEPHKNDHHQSGPNQSGLTLNNGKKWETDAPLRESMEKIRQEFSKHTKDMEAKKTTSDVYLKLSEMTTKEINHIIKNCKLPKDADAQLHFIVAEILGGAGKIKSGKDASAQREGAMQIISGLDRYGAFFDHPGWKGLR